MSINNTSPPRGLKVGGNAIVVTLVWLAGLLVAAPWPVIAGDHIDFDIATQNADRGLIEFARQAGFSVLLPTERISQFSTCEVRGSHEVEQALAMLLSGSGLSGELSRDGLVIIRVNQQGENTVRRSNNKQHCFANSAPERAETSTGFLSQIIAFLGSALAGSTTLPAHAQNTAEASWVLEEIMVTAERRTSTVQDTAASVTIRTGEELLNQGKYSLQSILEGIPGITGGAAENSATNVNGSTDSPSRGLTIRGIASSKGAGGALIGTSSAAAIYVDGVYDGVGGGYDIERVELLRGPQGTLYGRSATAGVLAIHTRNPDLINFGGDVTLEAGSYSLKHYGAALNLPIASEKLAVRVTGNRYQRDGYISREGGALANTDAKLKLLYAPTENLSILVGAALQNNDTHTGGLTATQTAPNDFIFTATPVSPNENKYRQYWAEINWNLGFATLTYLPAFRSWESSALTHIRLATVSRESVNEIPKDDFVTHEVRLASNTDSALTWLVGTLYYHNDVRSFQETTELAGPLVSRSITHRETTATGFFGQSTYSFTDRLSVTAGLRYDYTKVQTTQDYTVASGQTLSIAGNAGLSKFNNPTYKLRGEYKITAENLVYASFATGFAPGDVGAATGPGGQPIKIVIDDETLTAYEIGSKNRFRNDTLQLNGAVYYYDYGGYQVGNVNISNNIANPNFVVLSAPVEVRGGEIELVYKPWATDTVTLDLGYTDAQYRNKPALFAQYYARNHVTDVAPFTANAGYEHNFNLSGGSVLSLRGDVRYLSAHDVGIVTQAQLAAGDAVPWLRVGGETVGNVSASWLSPTSRYSISGYVRNVTDNQYKISGGVNLTNGRLSGSAGGTFGAFKPIYDPRTYGIVINCRF